jgi:ligand-binding sensor domain-containing protein
MFCRIKSVFIIVFLLGNMPCLKAQDIPIGTWQDHLSYNNGVSVTYGNGVAYCASQSAIFSYDNGEKTIERLNLISGLSDIEVSSIKFNPYNNKLILGYKNGNIDIIDANKSITNLAFIKNNSNVSGIKSINHIYLINQFAYLSTGFGIVVINTDKNEVTDTYMFSNLGAAVYTNAVAFDNNYIYAATNEGVFFADKNSFNLADYNEWSKLTDLGNSNYTNIVYFANKLVVSKDSPIWLADSVYYNNGTSWINFTPNPINISKLGVYNNKLLISGSGVNIYDDNFVNQGLLYTHAGAFSIEAAEAHLDENGNYWIADKTMGLLKQKDNSDVKRIVPNGPNTSSAFALDVQEGLTWVTSGGYGNYRSSAIFNYRENFEWKNVPSSITSPINGSAISDLVSVVINPENTNQVFVGSWNAGLLEFNNGTLSQVYNAQNSVLDSVFFGITAVSGMAFDQNNNLWVTSSYSTNILAVKTPSNNWYNFSLPGLTSSNSEYKKVIVDKNSFVWIVDAKNLKLLTFDYNNTFDNKNDDRAISPTTTAEMITLAEDLDGKIWFGTSQGVMVMYNPSNVFSGEAISPIYIQQDGQTQLLLETERVNAIAVDGANRKWFGTQNSGVFLMSEDGSEEILHFTMDNSPIFSNNIYDIKINNKTGEVFIATEKGLISYKGTATEAQDDFTNVFVYPNPVREDYNGVIAIRGLVKDTDVRITDISGNLVSQTKSLGGQAIWDGKDLNGNRVQTGVYMVFNASPDGELSMAAKILFIH